MTEPTDAELEALAVEHEAFGFGLADKQGLSTHGFDPDGLRSFARAVLAKWGTPAVANEPWGACIGGRAWVGKLLPEIALRMAEAEGRPIQWLYTTPQPTQPGAVPLTDSAARALVWSASDWIRSESINEDDVLEIVRATEAAHGIKGGQHGAE